MFNQHPCFFLTVNRVYVKPVPLSWSMMTLAKNGCQSNQVSRASVASTSTTTLSTTASAWWESNYRTSRWEMSVAQHHREKRVCDMILLYTEGWKITWKCDQCSSILVFCPVTVQYRHQKSSPCSRSSFVCVTEEVWSVTANCMDIKQLQSLIFLNTSLFLYCNQSRVILYSNRKKAILEFNSMIQFNIVSIGICHWTIHSGDSIKMFYE